MVCKAIKLVGEPIFLLEGVNTFKQILYIAYKEGANPSKRKVEASKEKLKRSKDPDVGIKGVQISASAVNTAQA